MQPCDLRDVNSWNAYLSGVFANISAKEQKELDLSSKNLRDENVIPLAEALKTYSSPIQRINLQDNEISDLGAKALASALILNNYLIQGIFRTLNLQANKIGKEGLQALLTAFLLTHRFDDQMNTLEVDSDEKSEAALEFAMDQVEKKIHNLRIEEYLKAIGLNDFAHNKSIIVEQMYKQEGET